MVKSFTAPNNSVTIRPEVIFVHAGIEATQPLICESDLALGVRH